MKFLQCEAIIDLKLPASTWTHKSGSYFNEASVLVGGAREISGSIKWRKLSILKFYFDGIDLIIFEKY